MEKFENSEKHLKAFYYCQTDIHKIIHTINININVKLGLTLKILNININLKLGLHIKHTKYKSKLKIRQNLQVLLGDVPSLGW